VEKQHWIPFQTSKENRDISTPCFLQNIDTLSSDKAVQGKVIYSCEG